MIPTIIAYKIYLIIMQIFQIHQNIILVIQVVKVKVVKVKGPVGQGQTKKIMTPAGEFRSRNEAARFFGFRPKQITEWTRAFPKQFYYIKA